MRKRWDSWADAPRAPGTTSSHVARPFAFPPPLPRNASDLISSSFASLSAATMLGEFPLEVIATTRSPLFARPAICLANTWSKPKSFPMQETSEPSEERATAGRDLRLPSYRPTSSVAKCAASAALPPLPQTRSLPPPRSVPRISSPAASTAPRIPASDSSVRTVSASDFSNVIRPSKWATDLPATEFFDVLERFLRTLKSRPRNRDNSDAHPEGLPERRRRRSLLHGKAPVPLRLQRAGQVEPARGGGLPHRAALVSGARQRLSPHAPPPRGGHGVHGRAGEPRSRAPRDQDPAGRKGALVRSDEGDAARGPHRKVSDGRLFIAGSPADPGCPGAQAPMAGPHPGRDGPRLPGRAPGLRSGPGRQERAPEEAGAGSVGRVDCIRPDACPGGA